MSDRNRPLHTECWSAETTAARRVLLVPGITSSAATMWELGEGLARAGWSATAVDLPGHGGSGLADSYRFTDVAGSLTAQLGTGWDLVIGHSLGGAIATVLLATTPGFAARALLIDPALFAPDCVVDELVSDLQRDQAADTSATTATAHPQWHPRTVAERVRSTQSTVVDAVAGYAAQNRPWDVRDRARAVSVPVHVLVPTVEPVVTEGVIREISATTSPRWTFETVPDTTHSVHRDRPLLVVDSAIQFPPDTISGSPTAESFEVL